MAIADFPWCEKGFAQKVAKTLGVDSIKFVGGAVRDSLLGKPVHDIDAATTHTPNIVMDLLNKAGIKNIPTGLSHGTVTAIDLATNQKIEITTLRRDVVTDGRHADVAFTNDWVEDAARRDFTMNALYLSPDGTLFDPLQGLEDLKAGRVRFIGKAEERITEDALRILRLFRFQAYYGREPLAKGDLKAVQNHVNLLTGLSMERVRDETLKLLAADAPASIIKTMESLGLIATIFPLAEDAVKHLSALQEQDAGWNIETRSLRRLLALVPQQRAKKIAQNLKLSGKQQTHIANVLLAQKHLETMPLKTLAYTYGITASMDAFLLDTDKDNTDELFMLEGYDVPVFPVTGKDLLALGYTQGEALGKSLKILEKQWIKSNFSSDKRTLISLL